MRALPQLVRNLLENNEDVLAWLLAVTAAFCYMAIGFAAITWSMMQLH